jgi:hypothetical protein
LKYVRPFDKRFFENSCENDEIGKLSSTKSKSTDILFTNVVGGCIQVTFVAIGGRGVEA